MKKMIYPLVLFTASYLYIRHNVARPKRVAMLEGKHLSSITYNSKRYYSFTYPFITSNYFFDTIHTSERRIFTMHKLVEHRC
jgi:hypothetical protein